MKRYKLLIATFALSGLFTSCGDDFLTTESAGAVPTTAGQPANEAEIFKALVASYNILLHDDYSGGYNSLLLTSDLRGDDLYKGGESAGDQQQLYYLATFTNTPANTLSGLYNLMYSGVAKANNAVVYCNNADASCNPETVKRYRAEALLLRAYYYHWLWKEWGNIAYFTDALKMPYVTEQLKADDVYTRIMDDIAETETLASSLPWRTNQSGVKDEIGRLNRAFLYMLKARVVMYQKDESRYAEVADNMASIIKEGGYDLYPVFGDLWLNEAEFCNESIFEVNYMPGGAGNWDGGNGYGTVLPTFISPNGLIEPSNLFGGGWGFGPVRTNVWENVWEAGDTRREGSINDWRPTTTTGVSYNGRFQDTGLYQKKYAKRVGYENSGTKDVLQINNMRVFRYAEALLNYAELTLTTGEKQGVSAQASLDKVRTRAGVGSIAVNLDNIKKERRREFMSEGLRFWDLVRWGDAPTVLTESITERTPAGGTWSWSRTFKPEHKYLPFPETEINVTMGTAYPLAQNPGWN